MRISSVNLRSLGTSSATAINSLSRLTLPLKNISAPILGVLLAKWFWILFAPLTLYTAQIPDRTGSFEAAGIFGNATSFETTVTGVAPSNIELMGLFAPSNGKQGFAVFKLDDNRQTGVAVGQEIITGTELKEVNSDYVVIEHAGVKQRINLDNNLSDPEKYGIQPVSGATGKAAQSNFAGLSEAKSLINQAAQSQNKNTGYTANNAEMARSKAPIANTPNNNKQVKMESLDNKSSTPPENAETFVIKSEAFKSQSK